MGLATIAIVTRHLGVGEFGRLGLLLIFSAMLTVIYNLGSLQGTLMWVFGAAEDDAGGSDEGEARVARDKRRALGSSLILTLLVGVAGGLAVAAAAPTMSSVVTGETRYANAVIWAAVAGGLGALWRLISNIVRFERKPANYAILNAVRPIAVLAGVAWLVTAGKGVEGVLAGTALGTAVALVPALVVTAPTYRPALSRSDLARIGRLGVAFVPVIVSFWVVQNVDLYLLSISAPEDETGLYRIASRVANVLSYFVSAFILAWLPLTRSGVHVAVERERGRAAFGVLFTTYYWFASLWLLVALAIASDVLVRIAPPAYVGAAPLIPVIGTGFVAYGAYIVIYRSVSFPAKRVIYITLAAVAAVTFAIAAVLLIPLYGAYGAAVSPTIGFGVACAAMMLVARRRSPEWPFDSRRLAAGAAIAAGCLALGLWGYGAAGSFGVVLEVGSLALFPAALVVTRVLPRRHIAILRAILRTALRPQGGRAAAQAKLGRLEPPDRALVELLVRHREPPSEVARFIGTDEESLLRRFVSALRTLADVAGAGSDDVRVGRHLLAGGAVVERDVVTRELWSRGTDPDELDRLEEAMGWVSRLRAQVWDAPRVATAR